MINLQLKSKLRSAYYLSKYLVSKSGWRNNWTNQDGPIFILSFDLDYVEDYRALPWLLTTLKKNKIPVAFACIGRFVEKFPALHRKIIMDGHEIINHTYSHLNYPVLRSKKYFDQLSLGRRYNEIKRGHEAIYRVLKYRPRGFRAPHFRITNDTYSSLKKLNYLYSSSQAQFKIGVYGKPIKYDGIMEFPLSSCPSYPNQLLETYHWFRSRSQLPTSEAEELIYNEYKKLLAETVFKRSFSTVFFDPMDAVKMDNFDRFIQRLVKLRNNHKLYVARYGDLTGNEK